MTISESSSRACIETRSLTVDTSSPATSAASASRSARDKTIAFSAAATCASIPLPRCMDDLPGVPGVPAEPLPLPADASPLYAYPAAAPDDFRAMLDTWLPLTYALNAVNRSQTVFKAAQLGYISLAT